MDELDLDELLNDLGEQGEPEIEKSEVEKPTVEDIKNIVFDKTIEKASKEAKKTEDPDKYLEEYIADIQGSVREYLTERHRINEEIKALKSELKDLKEEMKDEGIKITAVDKAFKEMVSELKEDSQDAVLIESVKNMIQKDPTLYGMVREEAN